MGLCTQTDILFGRHLTNLTIPECDPTLRLLLKSGANPNAYASMPDGSKLSPLYFAVQVRKKLKKLWAFECF